MSLYDGLTVETAPVPELSSVPSSFSASPQPQQPVEVSNVKETEKRDWSASMKSMMASQLMRQQMTRVKAAEGRGGLSRGRGRRRGSGIVKTSVTQPTYLSEPMNLIEDDLAGEVQDEYDPMLPNNYEEIKKASSEKEEHERNVEREKRKEHYRRYANDSDSDEEREREEKRRRKKEHGRKEMVAVPPPSSLAPSTTNAFTSVDEIKPSVPAEEEDGNQVIRSALQELSKIKAPKVNPYGKKSFKTSAVASSIMEKLGWQEGQGLGKSSQGISTALEVEKTSMRGGKIVNVAAEREMIIEEEKKKVQSLTSVIKKPTKVVLLENMVGPGEVDDDLQPEVMEECRKYGEVTNCLIYEIPEGASDEESVRIFVEFSKMDSAIKAVIDLNGRYFGGRIIKASFYSEDKFSRFDLAPEAS